jgi:hypothetical protein
MRPPRESYAPLLPPYSLLSFVSVLHYRLVSPCRLSVKLFPIDLYRLAGKRCAFPSSFRFRYGPWRSTRSLLE